MTKSEAVNDKMDKIAVWTSFQRYECTRSRVPEIMLLRLKHKQQSRPTPTLVLAGCVRLTAPSPMGLA